MADGDGILLRFCLIPSLLGGQATLFLVVLNSFLAITATLANAVILAALCKESSLHPPSKILLRSLALTDFVTGILMEPLFVTFLMTAKSENMNHCNIEIIAGLFAGLVLFYVSLLTVTAISVDRLLALSLGMRYRQVFTLKRVLVIVIGFWILSVGIICSKFWIIEMFRYFGTILVPLCLVVSTCCYTKIYLKLVHHQAQIQQHVHQGQPTCGHSPLNIARYRKTVCSSLWVQCSVITCYLPLGVVTVLMANKGLLPSLLVSWAYSSTLLLFNSTLNPILYFWRIGEVRRAAFDVIKQIYCRS